ncbi:MAG TPA: vitamin K epoxide reductase family protein [Candidatus Paceibacterota bacterium]|jgi:uncharacterized membrane protein|nr:vitamin K epoxide reductase family protein [Candidatus Paceibacterota bacterium]
MQNILIILIILLGIIGFLLASYIYNKKKTKKKLICPMHSNCEQVINSDYSKIIGIPVEVLGIIYYLFTFVAYGLILIFNIQFAALFLLLLGISICSVGFSVYLISVQIIVIKQWCIWCLSSSFISLLIFALAYLHFILQ